MREHVEAAALKVLGYCEENHWSGYEPYDALNSDLLAGLPIFRYRTPRIAITQLLKRSPIDLRRMLRIPRMQNPKAIALFLSGMLDLTRACVVRRPDLIEDLIQTLIGLRSADERHWCWGYSFPWQTRTVLVPRWAPNLVCTAFAGGALLDAYEQLHDARCLPMAASAAEYLLGLYWSERGVAGFAYPLSSVRNQVHNANFLAADLLCRVARHTGESRYLEAALAAARYSSSQQRADGSWAYGEAASQQWIDNFHTGFNLCALRSIGRHAETEEFEPVLRRGFEFFRRRFLLEDGSVRYFHDRTYPIDAHCIAQSIITLMLLKDFDSSAESRAESVYGWAMSHLWDERGFFYYRKLRACTIRTSYMRWTQAWMFLALAVLLSGGSRRPDRRLGTHASVVEA